MAYEILVPQPGIEPTPFVLEGKFLATGPPGKSLNIFNISFQEIRIRHNTNGCDLSVEIFVRLFKLSF